MIVSNLLAKAFNHVVKQPISKFLYGGMMLKATYYGNRPSAIIYKLSRYSSDEENLIWSVEFDLPNGRRGGFRGVYGEPLEGEVDLLSYEHRYGRYDELWERGIVKLGKVKGDAAQFQRNLIIIRMFIEGENEYDHMRNGK